MMDYRQLCQIGILSDIDRQFAHLMGRCVQHDRDIVQMAAAFLSRSTAQGHVCLDLGLTIRLEGIQGEAQGVSAHLIDPAGWDAVLSHCSVVGRPGEYKPMILDGKRLYLHRLWQYEQDVALAIRQRCRSYINSDAEQDLADELAGFFPEGDESQRQAALSALVNGFTAISGGPGTGKTYTIAKLILLMQQLNTTSEVRLELAAPTGKAAMRLQQTLESAMAAMGNDHAIPKVGSDNIQTLHRLLGASANHSGFKYHAGRKLPVDMVMVDEASMIDLALMAALVAALPAAARLVLIGDKNQLASVEAGAVLGDICSGIDNREQAAPKGRQDATPDGCLAGRIVELKRGYRFADQSGIDALGAAVNAGEAKKVKALLHQQESKDVLFKKITDRHALQHAIEELTTDAIGPQFNTRDSLEALAGIDRLMLLSPLRHGPYGMVAVNRYVEQALFKNGQLRLWRTNDEPWYAGRPVMVTRNDYHHNLFNGDLGIAAAGSKGEKRSLSVFFSDGNKGYKQVPLRQLPPHQTAFAMTVHKSQGSEFDRVVLILPSRENPTLTRELIYTAITRARRTVEIWGTEQCLIHAIEQRVKRSSGLGKLLWGQGG